MNIYRVHCTVPPPFSKLQWQRWPPLVPRRSFYPPFSFLSHPLSSALFTLFSWLCAWPSFCFTCLLVLPLRPPGFARSPLSSHLFTRPFRPSFFLPSSSPFPLCPPYFFVFALPSPRLPFSCASARSPSRIWAIFPKKGGLQQMSK